MRKDKSKKKVRPKSPAELNYETALQQLREIPGIAGIRSEAVFRRDNSYPIGREDWAYVDAAGTIHANPKLYGEVGEWVYVLAHCCLHLAMGHIQEARNGDVLWNRACDCIVARFLRDAKIGTPPGCVSTQIPAKAKEEESLYQWLKEGGNLEAFGTTVSGRPDMVWKPQECLWRGPVDWEATFAEDLEYRMLMAVQEAGGEQKVQGGYRTFSIRRAREWFISSYPLLGALASRFKLVTDEDVVGRMGIPVAAVSSRMEEIYLNWRADLTDEEWKFVLAHEFLHAALRHDVRCGARDPELWNMACDFVINDWLRQMAVGAMPQGALYDQQFSGMSAEGVYDQLMEDVKLYRGRAPRDLLFDENEDWTCDEGAALDDYYRRAIQRGLEYHKQQGRGMLPGGLVEEINALASPPVPWDVELARWFDQRFQPLEPRRTYARLSRRQSSTPDIPRPAWRTDEELNDHIYGVLLDTSGSMDRHLLAVALGTIASYSQARDVNHVRVVFCDATPYDQGVMDPADIAGAVQIRGRGGTVLQPAIDLLDRDPEFPKEAPLLIITDGGCDRLNLRGREHAYLMPQGNRLPFPPKGPVFWLQ